MCVPTATALRVVRRGADSGVAAPLQRLRQSLLRLLPGPGPLLRLGRGELLGLHSFHQEVRGRPLLPPVAGACGDVCSVAVVFVAGGAGGRTSDTATRCGSAEALTPKVRRLPRVANALCSAQRHHLLSVFACSGETPERDDAVRRGGQQHVPGVSAPVPSGLRQVALPGGRKEETGGTVELFITLSALILVCSGLLCV